MPPGVAAGTLRRAQILLAQAVYSTDDRDRFQANLEAAISFGRSATFHLQNEYAHVPGFPPWWLAQQTALKNDPIASYFNEARTFIIHRGPMPVISIVTASMHEVVGPISDFVDATVKRGARWFRRSPALWVEDGLRPIRRRLARRRYRRQRKVLERLSRMKTITGTTTSGYYFFDGPTDGDALSLVAQYLDVVEHVISEADGQFGAGPG